MAKLVHANMQGQFNHQIKHNAAYHEEEAMNWSGKQDWKAMKDEFEKQNAAGRFVYHTVMEFAEIQADGNEDVERWIQKSIGATPKKEIVWQGDWAIERIVEKTRDLEYTNLLKKRLKEDQNLFEMILPRAASYRRWMEEPEKLKEQISELFEGKVLEDRPVFKDEKEEVKWFERQEKRLEKYRHLMEAAEAFKHKVDSHYLDVLGLNKPNMFQQLFSLMLNQRANAPNSVPGYNGQLPSETSDSMKEQSSAIMIKGLMNMEIERAQIFDVPLPEEYARIVGSKQVEEKVAKTKVKAN